MSTTAEISELERLIADLPGSGLLRQRYGHRDESRVDRGRLLAPAA